MFSGVKFKLFFCLSTRLSILLLAADTLFELLSDKLFDETEFVDISEDGNNICLGSGVWLTSLMVEEGHIAFFTRCCFILQSGRRQLHCSALQVAPFFSSEK